MQGGIKKEGRFSPLFHIFFKKQKNPIDVRCTI